MRYELQKADAVTHYLLLWRTLIIFFFSNPGPPPRRAARGAQTLVFAMLGIRKLPTNYCMTLESAFTTTGPIHDAS